jgi:hypothetical protein
MTQEILNYFNPHLNLFLSVSGEVYLEGDAEKTPYKIRRFYKQGVGGAGIVYAAVARDDTVTIGGEKHVDAQYLRSLTDAKELAPISNVPSLAPAIVDMPTVGFKRVEFTITYREVIDLETTFALEIPDYVEDEATQRSIAWKYVAKNSGNLRDAAYEKKRDSLSSSIQPISKD